MPELKPSVADAPGNGRDAAVATPEPPGPDPLARLHKMSTTAGLGSTAYVAVNAPAVFALIFGLASALVVVDNVLLIIPLAGVICAVLAFYQIRKSGGTQTGRLLAGVGLALSIGFAGWVVTTQATHAARTRDDRNAITKLLDTLARHVKAGDFDAAYQLFAPRFRERVDAPTFSDRLKFLQQGAYGQLESITSNNVFSIETDPTTGDRRGAVLMLIKFSGSPQPLREEAVFYTAGGTWWFDNIPAMYSPPPPQGGGPPGAGGPPPGTGGPPPGAGGPPPG